MSLSALHCQEKHFAHQETVSHFALHVPCILTCSVKEHLSTWLFNCSLDTGIWAWLGDASIMCCSSFSLSPFCSWSMTTVSTISLLWLTMTNSPHLGLNSFPTSIQPCKLGSISQWTHTSPSKTSHFFFLATGRSLCIHPMKLWVFWLDGMLIHYVEWHQTSLY